MFAHDMVLKKAPGDHILVATSTTSFDGNVSAPAPADMRDQAWIFKIDRLGNMVWDKCYGGNTWERISDMLVEADGSFYVCGVTYSDNLPGSVQNAIDKGDGWLMKLDADGVTQWSRCIGGRYRDVFSSMAKTADGGLLITGYSYSKDRDICRNYGIDDMLMVKTNAIGEIEWHRTFGGTKADIGYKLILPDASSCLILSSSGSADIDLNFNAGLSDVWLSSYSFTGTLTKPSVSIQALPDSIFCPGKEVMFIAKPGNAGTAPTYNWTLNGVPTGMLGDTFRTVIMKATDIVSCTITGNDPCTDVRTSITSISVKVGTSSVPRYFLPADFSLCSFERPQLQPNRSFSSYLWSNQSTTKSIIARGPGTYWLEVKDEFNCVGRDSVRLILKPCIEGIFIPNAFSPNNDGNNDRFKPVMNVPVEKYRFSVFNRWGQLVFRSDQAAQGWDGRHNGIPCESGVYTWQCLYKLENAQEDSKRGTVLLIR